jgi:hypothetical protein
VFEQLDVGGDARASGLAGDAVGCRQGDDAAGDAALEKQIQRVCKDSGERYGAWKVWDQLNREGIPAARCTVERLMRKLGLRGVRRGGYKKVRTTVPDPSQDRPPDRVNRDFAPDAPDRLWVVDFTYVPTWAGTAYTALVIDAFSRLIAGWRTAASHSTGLVLDALVMAVTYRARQGVRVAGLVHHSDAGSEHGGDLQALAGGGRGDPGHRVLRRQPLQLPGLDLRHPRGHHRLRHSRRPRHRRDPPVPQRPRLDPRVLPPLAPAQAQSPHRSELRRQPSLGIPGNRHSTSWHAKTANHHLIPDGTQSGKVSAFER